MKSSEALSNAKNLFVDEKNWYSGPGKYKKYLGAETKFGKCHCPVTALDYITDSIADYNRAEAYLVKASSFIDPASPAFAQNLGLFNDSHCHQEVIDWMDKAIELAILDNN